MMTVTAPSPTALQRLAGSPSSRSTPIQFLLSAIVVIASWADTRELGLTGTNGLVTALLAVNTVFLLSRHLPAASVPERFELLLLGSWAVAAAALLSLHSLGVDPAFAYFAAGHAGYRLSLRPALFTAGAVGLLSVGGLWLVQRHGVSGWPPPLGLTVAMPVFLGMANRARDHAVSSALKAAEAGRRAAESEARAAESEAREQTLAERARISRDIHDVLAHSLSGVSMQLELSEMLLDDGDPARARDAISKARSMVKEGQVEARRAVTALRAEVLPLTQTLQAQFWGTGEVQIAGPIRSLSTEANQTLVRAAQEALTNARRHAPGAPIAVRLEYGSDVVVLQIDNGPAAGPVDAEAGSGMGLIGMRERAALLGGRADAGPIVDGALVGGWRVTVTLPDRAR